MALYSKSFMNKIGNCAFKGAVAIANNGGNFNNNLEEWDRDQLWNWEQSNLLLEDWENIFMSKLDDSKHNLIMSK